MRNIFRDAVEYVCRIPDNDTGRNAQLASLSCFTKSHLNSNVPHWLECYQIACGSNCQVLADDFRKNYPILLIWDYADTTGWIRCVNIRFFNEERFMRLVKAHDGTRQIFSLSGIREKNLVEIYNKYNNLNLYDIGILTSNFYCRENTQYLYVSYSPKKLNFGIMLHNYWVFKNCVDLDFLSVSQQKHKNYIDQILPNVRRIKVAQINDSSTKYIKYVTEELYLKIDVGNETEIEFNSSLRVISIALNYNDDFNLQEFIDKTFSNFPPELEIFKLVLPMHITNWCPDIKLPVLPSSLKKISIFDAGKITYHESNIKDVEWFKSLEKVIY